MRPKKQLLGTWLAVVMVTAWLAWPRETAVSRRDARLGFDLGFDVRMLARMLAEDGAKAPGGWTCMSVPGETSSFVTRNETRAALRELRRRGVRPFVQVRAGGHRWSSGVRTLPGAKGTLPLDLREAFAHAKWLGEHYGRDVEAWEIENEPELVYVRDNPENYAAYLKAMYLGLKRGALETATSNKEPASSNKGALDGERRAEDRASDKGQGLSHEQTAGDSWNLELGTSHPARGAWHLQDAPRVVMAPMAFPPGPYFDALLDNDLLSHTDGFNFHYFGYEEDFPGVYRQFEAAIAEWSQRSAVSRPQSAGGLDYSLPATRHQRLARRKSLPVFISEYGYGLLSGRAAATTEGRVRQWEYFRALAGHMRDLCIEAPMAFVLSPHLEDGSREFGLAMRSAAKDTAVRRQFPNRPASRTSAASEAHEGNGAGILSAGGVTFTPADFGAEIFESWMEDIGYRFGDWAASPALAWLLNQPALPDGRPWEVIVPMASPVVIDFVAGAGMRQNKTSRGHFLTAIEATEASGSGAIILYNFGQTATTGVLCIEGHAPEPLVVHIDLAPGERRELPLTLAVDREPFRATRWTARFDPDHSETPSARFQSNIYPEPVGLRSVVRSDLQHRELASAANAANLDTRQLARGEAPLQPAGRWRLTKGLRVEDRGSVWRFTIEGFPDEAMRPAIAELPLPDNFAFQSYDFFRAELRLLPRDSTEITPTIEPRSEPEFSTVDKETVGVYFRTEGGGLYATTMHFPVSTAGMRFVQMADNFTPAFYGRMHLPWRFLDNKPVSLVFMFRPRLLPATYEVRQAEIVRLVR